MKCPFCGAAETTVADTRINDDGDIVRRRRRCLRCDKRFPTCERAEIRLPNADTVSLRDAVIFLRCNDRFAEDTLTVRIATVTPDSLRFGEWFLLVIPHPKGPAALMREAAIPYRRRIRLTQHGDYRCSVTPVRPVRGVEAVGVDLQQSR